MTLHAIVFNPASGRRPTEGLAREVAAVFGADGHATRLLPTERPGHAADLVESLLRERTAEPTDVLTLGGDGTLNEALLGMYRAGALTGPDSPVRLAALPGGTTNVVCRSLGLPREPLAAARAFRAGRERLLDVGTCRMQAHRRPFLLACGAGFDADALLRLGTHLKRRLGKASYQIIGVLAAGHRDRGIVADIELADGSREVAACESVIAGASELYAGIVRLAADARPDDGLLEVALLSSTRLLALLSAAWHGARTSLADAPGVRVVKARGVRLTARREVPVHVDAEPVGWLPVELGVLPCALRMRVG